MIDTCSPSMGSPQDPTIPAMDMKKKIIQQTHDMQRKNMIYDHYIRQSKHTSVAGFVVGT